MEFESGSGSGVSNDTGGLTCAARSIQAPYQMLFQPPLSTVVIALQIIFFACLIVLSTGLNSFVFFLMAKFKKLQTLSFFIALQILITDFIRGSILTPMNLISAIARRWPFGESVCIIYGTVLVYTTLVRTALMVMVAIDRFLLIYYPFRYEKHRVKTVVILSLVAWLKTAVAVVVTLPGIMDCIAYISIFWHCFANSFCGLDCLAYINAYMCVVLIPSCIIPPCLYLALFLKARNIQNRTVFFSDKQKKEWRATMTLFLMILTVVVTIMPFCVFYVLVSSIYGFGPRPLWSNLVLMISYTFFLSFTVADPIFIMRNRDVREVVAGLKWFKKTRESNSQNEN